MEPMLLSIRQSTYRLYTEMFEKVRAENTLTQLEADILLFLSENKNQDTASEIISARTLSKYSHPESFISTSCLFTPFNINKNPPLSSLYFIPKDILT